MFTCPVRPHDLARRRTTGTARVWIAPARSRRAGQGHRLLLRHGQLDGQADRPHSRRLGASRTGGIRWWYSPPTTAISTAIMAPAGSAPGVVVDGQRHETRCGVPQGGVVSPVLANLYLHSLDRWWQDRHRRVGQLYRYCDDFVIVCRSRQAAEQARNLVVTEEAKRAKTLKQLAPRNVRYQELSKSNLRSRMASPSLDFLLTPTCQVSVRHLPFPVYCSLRAERSVR